MPAGGGDTNRHRARGVVELQPAAGTGLDDAGVVGVGERVRRCRPPVPHRTDDVWVVQVTGLEADHDGGADFGQHLETLLGVGVRRDEHRPALRRDVPLGCRQPVEPHLDALAVVGVAFEGGDGGRVQPVMQHSAGLGDLVDWGDHEVTCGRSARKRVRYPVVGS